MRCNHALKRFCKCRSTRITVGAEESVELLVKTPISLDSQRVVECELELSDARYIQRLEHTTAGQTKTAIDLDEIGDPQFFERLEVTANRTHLVPVFHRSVSLQHMPIVCTTPKPNHFTLIWNIFNHITSIIKERHHLAIRLQKADVIRIC